MTIMQYFALLHLREKLTESQSIVAVRAIRLIDEKLNIKNIS